MTGRPGTTSAILSPNAGRAKDLPNTPVHACHPAQRALPSTVTVSSTSHVNAPIDAVSKPRTDNRSGLARRSGRPPLLDRVKRAGSKNLRGPRRVLPGMRQLNNARVAVPGLAVVEVVAALR